MIRHLVRRVKRLDIGLAARLTTGHLLSIRCACMIRLSCQAIIERLLSQLIVVHHSAHIVIFLNGELGWRRLRYLRRPVLAGTEYLGLKIFLLLLHLVGFLYALHVLLHADVARWHGGLLLARRRRLVVQLRLEC